MVKVRLWGALADLAGGEETLNVEATDIRGLFRRLGEDYPAMQPHLKQGVAVSIDGVLYRDDWSKKLPQDGEIFLLPRIAGG